MNKSQLCEKTLWQTLTKAGLTNTEQLPQTEQHHPWYIRLLQGFAGWLAACFLMGFIGIVLLEPFLKDENAWLVATAATLCAALAFTIFRRKQHDFTLQLGLAFNLCAQLLFAWAFVLLFEHKSSSLYFALFALQSAFVVIQPNFMSRVLSSWFAMMALFFLLQSLGLGHLHTALVLILFSGVWLSDLRWGKRHALWLAVGYGLTLSVLMFSGQFIIDDLASLFISHAEREWSGAELMYWLNQSSIWLLFCYLIYAICQSYQLRLSAPTFCKLALVAAFAIAMSHLITGASGALLLLTIGFFKQRRTLVVLGILSLIGFISWYYYALHWTLLYKSLVLLGISVALGIAAYTLYLKLAARTLTLGTLKQKYRLSANTIAATVVIVTALVAVNFTIYQKEQVLSRGDIALLKLAPIDPRSLMQGDYMRLRFAIESTLLEEIEHTDTLDSLKQALFVVELDEHNVARFHAIYHGQSLQDNQLKMQFRVRDNKIRLSTHAFFFEEGSAAAFETAQYGEFRVADNGELLLNSMRDKNFNIIGYNRPEN